MAFVTSDFHHESHRCMDVLFIYRIVKISTFPPLLSTLFSSNDSSDQTRGDKVEAGGLVDVLKRRKREWRWGWKPGGSWRTKEEEKGGSIISSAAFVRQLTLLLFTSPCDSSLGLPSRHLQFDSARFILVRSCARERYPSKPRWVVDGVGKGGGRGRMRMEE